MPFGDPVPEKVDDVESVGEAVDGLDTQHLDPPPAAHDQRVNDQPQGESASEPDGVPRPYPLWEEPGHGDGGQRDDQRTERGADVVQEPRPGVPVALAISQTARPQGDLGGAARSPGRVLRGQLHDEGAHIGWHRLGQRRQRAITVS